MKLTSQAHYPRGASLPVKRVIQPTYTPTPQHQPLSQDTLAQFNQNVGRVTAMGALAGASIGGILACIVQGTSWAVAVAVTLSGALVGACVAEEQLRFKLGLPVEIPPAYR